MYTLYALYFLLKMLTISDVCNINLLILYNLFCFNNKYCFSFIRFSDSIN